MQQCFRFAVQAGFTGIHVLNHIDNQEGVAWRNFVDCDPVKRYGGFSYEDVIVRPTADALRTVTTTKTKVPLGGSSCRVTPAHGTMPIRMPCPPSVAPPSNYE